MTNILADILLLESNCSIETELSLLSSACMTTSAVDGCSMLAMCRAGTCWDALDDDDADDDDDDDDDDEDDDDDDDFLFSTCFKCKSCSHAFFLTT